MSQKPKRDISALTIIITRPIDIVVHIALYAIVYKSASYTFFSEVRIFDEI